ncbi:unnamed protein product, partial [Ectocarpus sp. 12 AP-2014]
GRHVLSRSTTPRRCYTGGSRERGRHATGLPASCWGAVTPTGQILSCAMLHEYRATQRPKKLRKTSGKVTPQFVKNNGHPFPLHRGRSSTELSQPKTYCGSYK